MRFFPPLKPLKHEINSEKNPWEVYQILRSATSSSASPFDSCDFVGQIDYPYFYIRPYIPFFRGSSFPEIEGKILKNKDKTVVNIEASSIMSFFTVIIYALGLLLIILGTGNIFTEGANAAAEFFIIAAICAFIAFAITQIFIYLPINIAFNRIKKLLS